MASFAHRCVVGNNVRDWMWHLSQGEQVFSWNLRCFALDLWGSTRYRRCGIGCGIYHKGNRCFLGIYAVLHLIFGAALVIAGAGLDVASITRGTGVFLEFTLFCT